MATNVTHDAQSKEKHIAQISMTWLRYCIVIIAMQWQKSG